MKIKYDTLEDTKAYVSSGGVTFQTPKFYMDKFIESMKVHPDQVEFEVQEKVENANDDETLNTTYGKLKAEVKLDFNNELMEKTVGMVIALDIQKPMIKVYTGARVFACTNLSIANADNVFGADIMQNIDSAYAMLNQYRTEADKEWVKALETWKRMQETILSGSEVEAKVGEMLRKVIKGGQFKALGTNPVTTAAKYLFGNDGPYRMTDNSTTMWNIYNSITQAITNSKDIYTAPTKSVIATKLVLN